MHGYWKRPSLVRDHNHEGHRAGHLCLGPLQVNWGYSPGIRVYLTWPGRTRGFSVGVS